MPNPSVRLALEFDTSRCSVVGNTIEIASGYPHFRGDSAAIAALGDKGIAIRDLRIGENNITIPAGSADEADDRGERAERDARRHVLHRRGRAAPPA